MSELPKLYFITGSADKVREVKASLPENFPFEIENKKIDLPEIQGEVEEVALAKCKEAALQIKDHFFTEDTCLCFNAWNGLPGPYIRSFVDNIGVPALPRLLDGFKDKSAVAICTLGYWDGKEVRLFQGRVNGTIVEADAREDAYGWDAVFQPEGYSQTFGRLDPEVKRKIGHRGRAVTSFSEYITSLNTKQ